MPVTSRVAFTVLGRDIYWYGILMALSILLAALVLYAREKRYALPRDTTVNLSLCAVPAALVCARAYYVAFSWEQYAADPLSVFYFREGGMAIYGGILGGALAGYLYARIKKLPFLTLCDLAAPGLALGQAIGRWGNFLNQEAYGYAVTNPALRWFPFAVFIEKENGWFLATFFYESAWCFLLALFLLIYEKMRPERPRGRVFLLYALLYALERAFVEGLRTDSLYWGPIRVSQALSALVALVCVALLLYKGRRKEGV